MKTVKWLFKVIKSNFSKIPCIIRDLNYNTRDIITFNIRRDSPNDGENQ